MKTLILLLCMFICTICNAQNFDIYVSDAGNFTNPPWQILKFDANGQNPLTFINSNLNWPQDIVFLEDLGEVLISNLGTGRITRYNATTGAFISDFATGIGGPTRMKFGPDSLLYVLQWNGNGRVVRFQKDGTYMGEFTTVGVPQSIGLDWDANENLYVSSYSGHYVRKYDTNGVDMGLFVNTNLLGPTNIWFDDAGDLLVSDYNGTSVKRFDATGAFTGDFIQGLMSSEGVAVFPNGDILIGNGGTSSVKLFNSSGMYLQDLIVTGSGGLLTPNVVVLRSTTSTSVETFDSRQNTILFPSVGSEFSIGYSYQGKIKALEFHDVSGKLMQTIYDPQSATIDATRLPQGMYIVKITFNDGKIWNQKLIKVVG